MNEVLPYFHYGRIPLPCHPEQHILCHSERSEESQGFRYYSNVSVDHDPAAFRFFASVRSTQNDKWKQCVQNDRLEHLILCHPERSEGSKSCRCFSNVSVDYAPTAFRFFASLRFAQNDKSGRSAQNDKFGSESLTAFKDKLREELFPTQCHPEPFTVFKDKLREGSQRQRYYMDVLILFVPVIAEVNPFGIGCFYQLNLLSSQPAFDGFFSGYCRSDVTERFIIDELVNVVLLSKTLYEFILMLMYSVNDVVGQTDIKRAGSVGQNVYVILMVRTHTLHYIVKLCPLPDSSAVPQNDKCGYEPFTAFKDRLREELFPTQCHPERSEGSKYYRRYSDAPVGYAPAALRFFASLRSAQNDKQGRCRQNDKQGQCVQTCP